MKTLKKVIFITMLSAIFVLAEKTNTNFAAEVLKIDLNHFNSADNITVSDAMSYDEMAVVMAKDQDIPLMKAKKILGNETSEKSNRNSSNLLAQSVSSVGYRTVAVEFTVGMFYFPKLTFYCTTNEGGSLGWGIVSVLGTMLNTTDKYNTSKRFQGTVYTNLESITSIYYMINGQFFDNSSTTATAGIQIGLGEGSNISRSSSSTTNFYAGISEYGRFSQYQ